MPVTFTYTPAVGSILRAGAKTLSATFVPSNRTAYNNVSRSVSLVVKQAAPAIAWPTPAPIQAGFPLSAIELDATAKIPGKFTYTPALGSVPESGKRRVSATFAPYNSNDYTSRSISATLLVGSSTRSDR